jgi:hypothetical protein
MSSVASEQRYRLAKAALVKPCVRCNDPKGYQRRTDIRPRRFKGTPFSIKGDICLACRQKLMADAELAEGASESKDNLMVMRPPKYRPPAVDAGHIKDVWYFVQWSDRIVIYSRQSEVTS